MSDAPVQHVQCADCGKCRQVFDEEFCFICEYRSCERGEDCTDATVTARAVLDAIKAQLAAATPGPWSVNIDSTIDGPNYAEVLCRGQVECMSYCYGGTSTLEGDNLASDTAFIAAAPGNIERLTNALEAVLSMADAWEADYGPGSRAEQVLGKQKVSIDFAVGQIRTAIEKALTD